MLSNRNSIIDPNFIYAMNIVSYMATTTHVVKECLNSHTFLQGGWFMKQYTSRKEF
jgi:hypothetical protein